MNISNGGLARYDATFDSSTVRFKNILRQKAYFIEGFNIETKGSEIGIFSANEVVKI